MIRSHKTLRELSYLAVFLLSFHLALPAYISSAFLEVALGPELVGIVFAAVSLITILALQRMPAWFSRNGLLNTISLLAVLNIFLVFALVNTTSPLWIAGFFVVFHALGFLLRFGLDIFLEQVSPNQLTGGIRGLFMTLVNVAWLASPWLAAQSVSNGDFRSVFIMSGLLLVPFSIITLFALREVKQVPYPKLSIVAVLARLWQHRNQHHKNLYNILSIDLLLNFFYATMVIYMPLYLHDYLGMPWQDIGVIFTVMLVPFVIFDFPLGKLADHYIGEKELLIAGLVVMGVFTALIPLITSTKVLIWSIALFMTRVGASIVEIMKETYLFKQINGSDTEIVMFSRLTGPISYLVAPAVAVVILFLTSFGNLFATLGIISLLGLYPALNLEDTR